MTGNGMWRMGYGETGLRRLNGAGFPAYAGMTARGRE